MSDAEKIEAAAKAAHDEIDDQLALKWEFVECWKEAIKWRDRNPGPHVVALVEAAYAIEEIYSELGEVLAQFEKAVKDE